MTMTPMEQQLLNGLHRENGELKADLERLEDAADYWKDTFETFYNAIYIATARPSQTHSDGDCIEEIIDKLKAYNGESDELLELNY